MNRKVYDIKKKDDQWQGIVRGGERASVVSSTKSEAIKRTAEIARNHGHSQIVIRKENGVIQSERTYGNDPVTSKG